MIIKENTARALEMQRRAELRTLSEHDALVAVDRLLAMAANATYPPDKESSSGLIMRQSILYGIRK